MDRDNKGRFVKGHKPFIGKNPGRKPRPTEDKYLRVFSDTVTKEDLEEIILSVMARAKAQDMVAARIIFDYALGKPAQRVEVATTGDLNIALVWPEDEKYDDSPAGAA